MIPTSNLNKRCICGETHKGDSLSLCRHYEVINDAEETLQVVSLGKLKGITCLQTT